MSRMLLLTCFLCSSLIVAAKGEEGQAKVDEQKQEQTSPKKDSATRQTKNAKKKEHNKKPEKPKVDLATLKMPLDSAQIISFSLNTRIKNNRNVEVCYRLPKGYDRKGKRDLKYRTLLYFGGRNQPASRQAAGPVGFAQWADDNQIIILGIGFRDEEYWNVGEWSGVVIRRALQKVAKDHPLIDTKKLLVIGYSAGAQASNSFASTYPQLTRAWVSIGSGVWHEPNKRLVGVPGLIAVGDADARRYLLSRAYYKKYLSAGYRVIWKCLYQTGHEIDTEATGLASAFFDFYTHFYQRDLQIERTIGYQKKEIPTPYIGDNVDEVYYRADDPRVEGIEESERVYLPARSVAIYWGREAYKRVSITKP